MIIPFRQWLVMSMTMTPSDVQMTNDLIYQGRRWGRRWLVHQGGWPLEAASSLQSDFPPLPTRGGYCHKNCPFCTIHGLSAASLVTLLPALYIVQSQTAHHTSSPLGASAAYTHTVWCAQNITHHQCYLKNNPYVYFTQLVLSKKQPLRTSPN